MGEYFLRTIILLSLRMFHFHKEIFEKYTLLIVVLMIPKKTTLTKSEYPPLMLPGWVVGYSKRDYQKHSCYVIAENVWWW